MNRQIVLLNTFRRAPTTAHLKSQLSSQMETYSMAKLPPPLTSLSAGSFHHRHISLGLTVKSEVGEVKELLQDLTQDHLPSCLPFESLPFCKPVGRHWILWTFLPSILSQGSETFDLISIHNHFSTDWASLLNMETLWKAETRSVRECPFVR